MKSTLIAASHSSSITGSTSYCQPYSRGQANEVMVPLCPAASYLAAGVHLSDGVFTAAIRVAQMLFASQAVMFSRLKLGCLSLRI